MTNRVLERNQAFSRLTDSLRAIFSEALHLGVENLSFSLESGCVRISWIKAGQEVKTSEMNASWFEMLQDWFETRQCRLFGGGLIQEDEQRAESAGAVYLDRHTLLFSLRKGPRRNLRLSGFRKISVAEALRCFLLSEPFNTSFEQALQKQSGLVLAVSPDQSSLRQTVAGLLALGDYVYAGDAESEDVRSCACDLSRERVTILSTSGDDAVAGLLRLRELSYPVSELNLLGVLCQVLPRAVCSDCARETVPDRTSVDALPPVLKPPADLPYFVGRGCGSCGHSGYLGVAGVQSTAVPNAAVLTKLAQGANHSELVEILYPLGTASLLEDGLKKVHKGIVTYESLFKFVRSAPLAYLKEAQRRKSREQEGAAIPGMDFDTAIDQGLKPLAGAAAFGKEPAQFAGSQSSRSLLMIVEDDPDQRSILEMVFKGAEYDVRMASSGEQALQMLKREIPDLIISDLMMPGMDGKEFVLRVKAEPRYRDVPILILTVVSDSDKEYSLLDVGADDYCEKTIQRKILLKRVGNLLKRFRR